MQGLRTHEGQKFDNFFKLIQDEAKKYNAVFFLDSGEGNDVEFENLDCSNLSGWLIPIDKVHEFEKEYNERTENETDKWDDFLIFESWKILNDKIVIHFFHPVTNYLYEHITLNDEDDK